MNDDWRLRIELHNERNARALTHALNEHEREGQGAASLHDRVVVSHDGDEVFAYTGTREQAQDTQRTVQQLAAEHGWELEFVLQHWHPTAEEWEDPDTPLPATDAQRAAEHRERIAQEQADSAAEGYPEFEVRVQCASRSEASALARKLQDEGIPLVQRASAVLIGASDEDSANELADRLRAEAPAGSAVTVEGNLRAVYDGRPWWRPFWVLGGLGG